MNWNFTDNSSWIHLTRRHWAKGLVISVLGGLAVQSELRQQEILENSRRCTVSDLQQGGAAVARVAHNHEVAGSIPAPATNTEEATGNIASTYTSDWRPASSVTNIAVSSNEPDAPQPGGAIAPGSVHHFPSNQLADR